MNGCPLSRRQLLEMTLLGAAGLFLDPAGAGAQLLEREHRPTLDAPNLAEYPIAVPVRVSVDHPMAPSHFIESVEVVLETDPVPEKGTYQFTPANGRAWVSFPMRSGAGGLLKAIATCSRHGRFVGTRELRVAGDGCASDLDAAAKDRLGNPKLRVLRAPQVGEVVEVLARLDHGSDTGLLLKAGRYVRVRSEFFLKEMHVYLGRQKISEF
ncbi:MAG: thiosulfate oxidation carrier protein SoxY, partial [Candidatus Rokuibacteriota bacterium]